MHVQVRRAQTTPFALLWVRDPILATANVDTRGMSVRLMPTSAPRAPAITTPTVWTRHSTARSPLTPTSACATRALSVTTVLTSCRRAGRCRVRTMVPVWTPQRMGTVVCARRDGTMVALGPGYVFILSVSKCNKIYLHRYLFTNK